MNYSKIVTKEDVELETLKKFLINQDSVFNGTLIDKNKSEPTDIRYDGINYQITEGDKESVQLSRQTTSKGARFSTIRNVFNIAELLLRGTLKKKKDRSDKKTILLIDVMSAGGCDWVQLEREVSDWVNNNFSICKCWGAIYLVYRGKNIKLIF